GESQTELNGHIHLSHRLRFQRSQTLGKPLSIDGTDLVQEHDRIHLEPAFLCFDQNFGGIQWFSELRRQRGDDRDRTVPVGKIVLNDQSWPGFLDSDPTVGSKLTSYTSPRFGLLTFSLLAMICPPTKTTLL